jgi:hypothetical protein
MKMFRDFTGQEWTAVALATVVMLAPLVPYVL